MARFSYLSSDFDLVVLSAIVISLALSIAFIPWLRLVFTATLQIPTQFAWEYLGLHKLLKFLHLDYKALKQKKLKALSYISQHRRMADGKEKKKGGMKSSPITEGTTSNDSNGTASSGDEPVRSEKGKHWLTSHLGGRRTSLRHRMLPGDLESGVDHT